MAASKKSGDVIAPADNNSIGSIEPGKLENSDDSFEVFKSGDGNVEFRTVGWIHASVIFLKSRLPRFVRFRRYD